MLKHLVLGAVMLGLASCAQPVGESSQKSDSAGPDSTGPEAPVSSAPKNGDAPLDTPPEPQPFPEPKPEPEPVRNEPDRAERPDRSEETPPAAANGEHESVELPDRSVPAIDPPEMDESIREIAEESAAFEFDEALQLEVVTEFLYPDYDYKPDDDEPPVGLLLLSATQTAKNAFLCDGYLRELRTYEEARAAEPDSDFLITYWPLETAPERFDSCETIINHYDYARAAQLRAIFGLTEMEGPVILAVDSAGDSVFLDLTDATPEASRAALKSWLSLALEESTEPAEETEAGSSGTVGSGAALLGTGGAHRLTLSSFSATVKKRMLTEGGAGLALTERRLGDGRVMYAYKDPNTGYSVGSTIRF